MKSAEAALECLDRALALQPALPEAHSNRGNVLRDLRRPDAAIAAYDRAISLQPTFAEAHYNRGIALRDLRQHAAAIIDFEKAIALRPGYVEALNALGNAHLDLGAVSAAIESYAAAAALDPSFRFLLGVLRHARMKICDWNEWQADLEAIVAGIAAGRAVAPPFAVLGLVDSPRLHAKAAEIWVQHEFPASARLGTLPARARHDRIRLAYVSGDFRDHPVAALTVELIEIHDRSRFEVIGISHGARAQDELSLRIEGAFDRFIDVRDQSDVEIAGLLRELEIDIVVDLGGFTQGSRPGVFALRAAPVQIGYLGYLGTLSAEYMDYLVADETIIPSSDAVLYRERIIWLPSYQVNDSKRRMAERRFTRADCGLPPEGFVFCCFNAPYKLTPETFSSWMRILARAERSVLFLYCDDASAAANLGRAAEQRGIDPNRLIFGGRLSRPEYLARYLVADLFLDTLPYNAGTTASDALWAGLPVLTVMGKAFAGRVAASVLQAAGLPELITRTSCEYEDKAVELATDPSLLARIRLRLEQNRRTTPLFDTPSFARSLETAYRIIDERRLTGLPLDHVRREEISSRLATTPS
jgi:predicted O-linked N-acetylglucosamine transferase (SPINDLY family)